MSDLQVILVCLLNQLRSCSVSFSALVASSYCPPPSIPCHLPGLQAWPTCGVSGNTSLLAHGFSVLDICLKWWEVRDEGNGRSPIVSGS